MKRGSYVQLYKHVRLFCSDKFKACQLIFKGVQLIEMYKNMEPVNLTKVF